MVLSEKLSHQLFCLTTIYMSFTVLLSNNVQVIKKYEEYYNHNWIMNSKNQNNGYLKNKRNFVVLIYKYSYGQNLSKPLGFLC